LTVGVGTIATIDDHKLAGSACASCDGTSLSFTSAGTAPPTAIEKLTLGNALLRILRGVVLDCLYLRPAEWGRFDFSVPVICSFRSTNNPANGGRTVISGKKMPAAHPMHTLPANLEGRLLNLMQLLQKKDPRPPNLKSLMLHASAKDRLSRISA
jgi:hypothetical protein